MEKKESLLDNDGGILPDDEIAVGTYVYIRLRGRVSMLSSGRLCSRTFPPVRLSAQPHCPTRTVTRTKQ